MKKRIISLILVLVTLCLTFASCDKYSIADENMASYAKLTSTKEDFYAALAAIEIEDGGFTANEETRANKVWDSIYDVVVSISSKNADLLTKDAPDANDVVTYNYYYSYTRPHPESGVNETFYFTDNMASAKAVSIKLGKKELTDFEKKVKEVLEGKNMDGFNYITESTGTTAIGDVVYVSYKCTWEVDGKVEGYTATNERIVLNKGNSAFIDYLIGKDINKSTIEDFPKEADRVSGEKVYTNIKIDWRASKVEAMGSFADVTYTEDKTVKDIYGLPHNLKGQTLTYYVYPVNYVQVPEYTAENFINEVIKSDISYADVVEFIFGKELKDVDAATIELYKTLDMAGASISFETLVINIANTQKAYADAVTNKKNADADLPVKESAFATAKKNYENAPTDPDLKAKYDTAEANVNAARAAVETANKAYNEALYNRDFFVNSFVEVTEMNKSGTERFNLTDGYYNYMYDYLRDTYNEEIKLKLAKKAYELIDKQVELIGDLPEKAVKQTVETIIENHEYEFYNSTTCKAKGCNNAKEHTSYFHFKGDFNEYLKSVVENSNGSYDFAMASIEKQAKEYVTPIVKIYALSDALGVRVNEKEFKEYMKNDDGSYEYDSYTYGENSTRYAYQFDKLMNHLLEYEEVDGNYVYKNIPKINFIEK